MAGVAAQRTVITSIVKAPVLLTDIVYMFPMFTSECLGLPQVAVIKITASCDRLTDPNSETSSLVRSRSCLPNTRNRSPIDRVSVGVDLMQRNFEPMQKQVEV